MQEPELIESRPSFADLGLKPALVLALENLGFEEPTPIQEQAIPVLMTGRDLVGGAATGTGKTAAFSLPMLQMLPTKGGPIRLIGLVLVPTRELAVQVAEAIHDYGRQLGVQVLAVYGGAPIGRQMAALDRGMHIVVATPGRALDHLKRGSLNFDDLEVVVLDEADEMLDMGFADELDAIMEATPPQRQTVLFSATLPRRITDIASRYLSNPQRIQVAKEKVVGDGPLIEQRSYLVPRGFKNQALGRILDVEAPTATLVFCSTRIEVDSLAETLNQRGYRAEALHGGMDQPQRDRVMNRLRSGSADLVVATDVAARGLDVDVLTHVVNFEPPSSAETYTHRIGRVGRAGRSGVALTLCYPRELGQLSNIERRQKISLAPKDVPSVEDLKQHRLARLSTKISQVDISAAADFEVLLDELTSEEDLRKVALGALKLAYDHSVGVDDDVEIPPVERRHNNERSARGERTGKGKNQRFERDRRGGTKGYKLSGDVVSLYIGIGKSSGLRPADLVGAIANETRLNGKDIGAIRVASRFTTVEVPAHSADEVIKVLSRTTIRGQKTSVRRDRGPKR